MNKLIHDLLYDENLGKTRLLTKNEEVEIFKLFYEDSSLREAVHTIMLKANEKLVYSIARKYHPMITLNSDDILQLGFIGLSNAVDKFDVDKNVKFATYATYWIIQSISRGLQNELNNLNVSLKTTELKKLFIETEDELIQKLKRTPTYDEIITSMGIDEEDAKNISFTTNFESLDENINEHKTFGDNIKSNDISSEEKVLNQEQVNIVLESLERLTEKEKLVVKYHFGLVDGKPYSYQEIGDILKISKQRVQVIFHQALSKLKIIVKQYNK